MASIMIRNLDYEAKAFLHVRATEHRYSIEKELRRILQIAVGKPASLANSCEVIHCLFATLRSVVARLQAYIGHCAKYAPMLMAN